MNIPTVHIIKVTKHGATATRPATLRLTSERYGQRVRLGFTNYNTNKIEEIAQIWLTENGFDIIGKAEGQGCMYIVTDTFEPLVKEKEIEDVSVSFAEKGKWDITRVDEMLPFHSEATFKLVEAYCERNKYNITNVFGEDGEAW